MHRARHLLTTGLALAFALAVSGACDTRIPPVPQLEPQVVNLRNSFAFQATNLLGVNEDVTYSWQIDGTTATVAQTPTALLGNATVFVTDSPSAVIAHMTVSGGSSQGDGGNVYNTGNLLLDHVRVTGGSARFRGCVAGRPARLSRRMPGRPARFGGTMPDGAAGFGDRMAGLGGGVGRRLADRLGGRGLHQAG